MTTTPGSRPVYTSTAEGFRDEKEIAALRPVLPNKRGGPRKRPTVLRRVTNGVICYCGERFSESQALEFMIHLRTEVGEDLSTLERKRAQNRKAAKKWNDANRERRREYERARFADPEMRERKNAQTREIKRRIRADPERRARENAQERENSARRRAAIRELHLRGDHGRCYASRCVAAKAEREAADASA